MIPMTMILPRPVARESGMIPFFRSEPADHTRRVAGGDRHRGYVVIDNRACADDRALADRYAREDARLEADPDVATETDRARGHDFSQATVRTPGRVAEGRAPGFEIEPR